MEREQFMSQLERLLSDISETERREALDYYEGYFDDAGPEQEAAVIRELGSPGKVAAIIKADLEESNDRYAQYTEWGYEDTRRKEPGEVPDKYTAVAAAGGGFEEETDSISGNTSGKDGGSGTGTSEGAGETGRQGQRRDRANRRAGERAGGRASQWYQNTGPDTGQSGSWNTEKGTGQEGYGGRNMGAGAAQGYGSRSTEEGPDREGGRSRRERGYHADRRKNNAVVILILILLVFISPLIKGTLGGVLGLILVLVMFPLILILLFGVIAAALTLRGISVILRGIASCIGNPAVGVLRVGVGCILTAVGILFILLAVWAASRLLPRWIRWFTDLCQRILNGRKKGDET